MEIAYYQKHHSGKARRRTISSIFCAVGNVPLLGEPVCRGLTALSGSRALSRAAPAEESKSGLDAFSEAAAATMKGRHGFPFLPEVLMRSRLAGHYAERLARQCIRLGVAKDVSLMRLAKEVSPYTKIGLYCMPQAISDHERVAGRSMPDHFLRIMRDCYPDFSWRFLRAFDDGSEEFAKAALMVRYQQVAYDGVGSFRSPSYPFLDESGMPIRGMDLPMEARFTKLIEAFSSVLFRRFRPDLSDCEEPKHLDFAAAMMVAVSGKDVDPDLAAALLTALFPPTPMQYARMVVDRLASKDPRELERSDGFDGLLAAEIACSDVFRMMREIKSEAKAERKDRRKRERLHELFDEARTLPAWAAPGWLQGCEDDTVPGSYPAKKTG